MVKHYKFDFSFYYQEPEYKNYKKKSSKHDLLVTRVEETLSLCLGEELLEAAQHGDTERVRSLLLRNASVSIRNHAGWTALTWSAVNGFFNIARLLLRHGAAVNAKDNAGWPAHVWTAIYGHSKVTEVLLDHGAEVNYTDKDNWTPLIYAARYGHADVGKALLAAGAKSNMEDVYGWTALMRACYYEHTEFVRLLLDRGADPNRRSNRAQSWLDVGVGWTALMIASARNKRPQIINMLISNGARYEDENASNQTALDLATEHSVIKALENAPNVPRGQRPLTI